MSPADGIIALIEDVIPSADLGLDDAPVTRESVFMNVFNCHVIRAIIVGKVTNIVYRHGKFLNASLDKAIEHNERNSVTIEAPDGIRIGVVQISGLVARRIVCFVQEGSALGGRAPLWPDPVRQPSGRLPARWRIAAGGGRADSGCRGNRSGRFAGPQARPPWDCGMRTTSRFKLRHIVPSVVTAFAICAGYVLDPDGP